MFRYYNNSSNNNNNNIQNRMNLNRTSNYQQPLQRKNDFQEKKKSMTYC